VQHRHKGLQQCNTDTRDYNSATHTQGITTVQHRHKGLQQCNTDTRDCNSATQTQGITTVQHRHSQVISMRGKKEVASLTSAERGNLITAITCMNATGTYVPPLIMFPKKNMKQELMDGAPAGSISACHPSGWIQTDIFTKWFDHFVHFVKPSAGYPVLLIVDDHYSHTKNTDVVDKAREHSVSI